MEDEGYVIWYRESDRLIAEAFDLDSIPVVACAKLGPRVAPEEFPEFRIGN
jgi:hypothetical protein